MHTIEFETITYKFDLIDLDGETEWKSWARQQAMTEALQYSEDWPENIRAPFLAVVSREASLANCGFTAEHGTATLKTKEGVAKVLELASHRHMTAPHVPYEIMLRLVAAKENEAVRMAMLVIPISEES